jgi:hypothetical protein
MASGRGRLVDKLTRDVGKHADGRRRDDAALLLARFEPSAVLAGPGIEGQTL